MVEFGLLKIVGGEVQLDRSEWMFGGQLDQTYYLCTDGACWNDLQLRRMLAPSILTAVLEA